MTELTEVDLVLPIEDSLECANLRRRSETSGDRGYYPLPDVHPASRGAAWQCMAVWTVCRARVCCAHDIGTIVGWRKVACSKHGGANVGLTPTSHGRPHEYTWEHPEQF